MAPKPHRITSALLLLIAAATLLNSPPSSAADDTACPYPCYPPPTGGVRPSPPTQTSTPSAGFNYYPPPPFDYPTPTGNFPYYPPPSSYGGYGGGYDGGYGGGISPPPPDPILPYFPYYFKNGFHKDPSSSTATDHLLPRSTLQILLPVLVISVLYFPS